MVEATVTKKPSALITEVQHDEQTVLDMPFNGAPGKPSAAVVQRDAASLEFGAGGKPLVAAADLSSEFSDDFAAEKPAVVAEEAEAAVAVEALGEWKPEDPEVVSKFEARYFTKEGKLNLASVTKEFYSNAKAADKDGKGALVGTLHEDTYKFLEATLGVDKATAQQLERGLVADSARSTEAFYQQVGGKDRYNAAVEWGKKNYTAEQRERFNKATQGSDQAARDDAVDALFARFDKAVPKVTQAATRRGPPNGQRRAAPERTVAGQGSTAAGGSSVAAPYKTQADYTAAFQTAINAERTATTPQAKRDAATAREKVRADGKRSQPQWR